MAARSAEDVVVGTKRYLSGAVYEGELKDGRPHGQGILTYNNGDVYDGELRDGKKQGKGVYKYTSGSVYDGEWKDDARHGTGTITWASGEVYEGEFVEGKENGKGTFKWKNGNVYEGEFLDGKRHGSGTMTWASGNVYEGSWAEGKESGKGTKSFANGTVFEGQWLEGRQHGKGIIKYASGDVNEGIWAGGRPTQMKRVTRTNGALSPNSNATPVVSSVSNADAQTNDAAPVAGQDLPIGRKLRSQRSQQRRLEIAKKACENCGVDDYEYKLRVCLGCNLALYCSTACQNAASRSHRRICSIASELPQRDADELRLLYDRDQLVDLDAGLRYGTKYMDNLKHLGISLSAMSEDDTVKLSEKRLSSLLRSKKGNLDSFLWLDGNTPVPGISKNGSGVWQELSGLKRLQLRYIAFDEVQPLCDLVGRQRDTLMVLCLQRVWINGSKAKSRRALAQAVSSCKHLVKLDLDAFLLMDSDLKVMLPDLLNLRVLELARDTDNSHEFTDNTCGLIARKCPGLQELNLNNHDQLSVRGIRKIFEGCINLRSFSTTSCKLSGNDIQTLLDAAPQLLALTLGSSKSYDSHRGIIDIIEATGGRTLVRFSSPSMMMCDPEALSAESREKYESQVEALGQIESKSDNPEVANEWEE